MFFLGLCPKPVTPPSGHLGLSLSIFVEKVVFKAKNTHFGNFRTPGNPPYLGQSPRNIIFGGASLNKQTNREDRVYAPVQSLSIHQK